MNAVTILNRGLAHHDWPMIERAANELQQAYCEEKGKNDQLHIENERNKRALADRDTELSICRERMSRPVTLIIAPAISLWLSGLPHSMADMAQVVFDWIDGKVERVPETVTVPARLAVGMAALMTIVCAGMVMGFEAVAGGF